MKLLRLAMLHFTPFPEDWHTFTMTIEGVELGTIASWGDKEKERICVVAQVDLPDRLEITPDHAIIVPAAARRQAERAVEMAANMIAVAENCARSISSPTPCLALLPENPEEQTFLDTTKGIMPSKERGVVGGGYRVNEGIMVQAFADRLDGVALLAEALSHKHATGRFHEFIRLFERAVKLSSRELIDALSEYLISEGHGYTEGEVKRWVKDLRDPATHADGKWHSHFVLESDIRPVIKRMEQAAYDVLLNKAHWHNPSVERRNLWTPSAGTTSDSTDVFIVQGREVKLHFQILDEFNAYPSHLGAFIERMPEGWWSKWYDPSK